jgi:hypothetical protein
VVVLIASEGGSEGRAMLPGRGTFVKQLAPFRARGYRLQNVMSSFTRGVPAGASAGTMPAMFPSSSSLT